MIVRVFEFVWRYYGLGVRLIWLLDSCKQPSGLSVAVCQGLFATYLPVTSIRSPDFSVGEDNPDSKNLTLDYLFFGFLLDAALFANGNLQSIMFIGSLD